MKTRPDAGSGSVLSWRTRVRLQRFRTGCGLGFGLLATSSIFGSATAAPNLTSLTRQLGYQPIELRRSGENRLYLFGKLDRRKASVLVDTGWSYTTINTNAANQLASRPDLKLPPDDPFSSASQQTQVAVINSLRLGRVVFTNQPALVESLVFNGRRAPFEAVVGCDFLIRNFAVIDCANRRLYTRAAPSWPERQQALESHLRQDGFVSLDLKRTRPLALTGPARLNGEPVELLVDTGAVWSCLDAAVATRLGLKLLPSPRQIIGAGATGKRAFAVTKVVSFELAGLPLGSLNFAALPLEDWGLAAPGAALAGVGGILGGPELAAYDAILDCQASRLWLRPPSVRR